jgi:hypothetical protein
MPRAPRRLRSPPARARLGAHPSVDEGGDVGSASRTTRTVTSPASLDAGVGNSSMCRAVSPTRPRCRPGWAGRRPRTRRSARRRRTPRCRARPAAGSTGPPRDRRRARRGPRVQHEDGIGLAVRAEPGEVGEGRVRPEDVVAVVAAHLQPTGRDDQPLAGVCRARVAAGRGIRGTGAVRPAHRCGSLAGPRDTERLRCQSRVRPQEIKTNRRRRFVQPLSNPVGRWKMNSS